MVTPPEKSDSTVITHVDVKPLPVVVRREPEVGQAWEACCDELGICALGATPGEAAANLGDALRKRGLVDVVNVDRESVDALVLSERGDR